MNQVENSATKTVIEEKLGETIASNLTIVPSRYLKYDYKYLLDAKNGNTAEFAKRLLNNNWSKYPLVYIYGLNDIGKDQLAASYMAEYVVKNPENYEIKVYDAPNKYPVGAFRRISVYDLANPRWIFWKQYFNSVPHNSKMIVISGFGDDIDLEFNPAPDKKEAIKKEAMQGTILSLYDMECRAIITTNYAPKSYESHVIGRLREMIDPFFFNNEMQGKGWR